MNLSKVMIFNITLIFVLCYLIIGSDGALLKRSPSETAVSTEATTMTNTSTTSKSTKKNPSKKDSICGIKNICGWAIYDRRTRFIDYFMEADCDCETGQECFKSEDDISLSAYVYRCKLETTEKS